jgi:hypothetical protein
MIRATSPNCELCAVNTVVRTTRWLNYPPPPPLPPPPNCKLSEASTSERKHADKFEWREFRVCLPRDALRNDVTLLRAVGFIWQSVVLSLRFLKMLFIAKNICYVTRHDVLKPTRLYNIWWVARNVARILEMTSFGTRNYFGLLCLNRKIILKRILIDVLVILLPTNAYLLFCFYTSFYNLADMFRSVWIIIRASFTWTSFNFFTPYI